MDPRAPGPGRTPTRRDDAPSSRPLLDKLGVRPGAVVALIGVMDDAFRTLLSTRVAEIRGPTDLGLEPRPQIVFLAANDQAALGGLIELEPLIPRDGAIWVVSRKGRAATLKDIEVIAAATAVGLVDNKVVAFSETETALRLVVPRARR